MPKGTIFMNRSNDQMGTMNFELTSIYASGGPDFPLLTIRADIALSPYIERSQEPAAAYPLSLIRAVGQLRSPEHRVVARFQEDIALTADSPKYLSTTQVPFEIPLDVQTVNRIERERGSADLRVQLTFQLLFAVHAPNGKFGFYGGRIDGLTFPLPRSQWVDNASWTDAGKTPLSIAGRLWRSYWIRNHLPSRCPPNSAIGLRRGSTTI